MLHFRGIPLYNYLYPMCTMETCVIWNSTWTGITAFIFFKLLQEISLEMVTKIKYKTIIKQYTLHITWKPHKIQGIYRYKNCNSRDAFSWYYNCQNNGEQMYSSSSFNLENYSDHGDFPQSKMQAILFNWSHLWKVLQVLS